jgi:hypothetical protein
MYNIHTIYDKESDPPYIFIPNPKPYMQYTFVEPTEPYRREMIRCHRKTIKQYSELIKKDPFFCEMKFDISGSSSGSLLYDKNLGYSNCAHIRKQLQLCFPKIDIDLDCGSVSNKTLLTWK